MNTTPRAYTITLPPNIPLLNANQRLHHSPRARITDQIRSKTMELCSEDPIIRAALVTAGDQPVMRHAYILGIVHPKKLGRFDPPNWYPTFKAMVDGLVDAGMLEDDDHTRVIGPDMRPGTKVPGGRIVLVIQELLPAQHAAFQFASQQWTQAVAS
ncbi:hypothetical protein ACFC01_17920 [Streptomyces mirabilis]|uniref:hypothetical protein n=1 Tax=Streptomyces mirabilis TaxID=68239 RepID=UPI0035D58450